jgi:Flp pilus assembly protein TadG
MMLKNSRDETGAVAIITAICAVMLLVMAALVVDLGLARDTRRQSQNAADASSLAAANVLYPTTGQCAAPVGASPPCFADAVNVATQFADNNLGVAPTAWTTCSDPDHFYVPVGESECISFTDDSLSVAKPALPTKVRVRIPIREVKTGFGTLAGVSTVPVSSVARASLKPGGASACGLCVIGPGDHILQNGDALVTNTSVHFNGNLSLNPQGSVTSAGGTVSIQGTPPDKGVVTPPPATGVPEISDPMASLPLPPDMQGLTRKNPANMCAGGPGIYENPTASNCTLTPGLYVIIGGTLGGNNGVVADNVTMYFTCKTTTTPATPRTCNPGESGGTIDLSGNGNFRISAPAVSQNKSIPGVALAFDRNNKTTLRLVGNGTMNLSGALYMKSGTLDMRGNGCTTQTSIDSMMVIEDLAFSGSNACLDIDYTPGANYQPPPSALSLDQ